MCPRARTSVPAVTSASATRDELGSPPELNSNASSGKRGRSSAAALRGQARPPGWLQRPRRSLSAPGCVPPEGFMMRFCFYSRLLFFVVSFKMSSLTYELFISVLISTCSEDVSLWVIFSSMAARTPPCGGSRHTPSEGQRLRPAPEHLVLGRGRRCKGGQESGFRPPGGGPLARTPADRQGLLGHPQPCQAPRLRDQSSRA